MNIDEKKRIAKKILKEHGYSDKEIGDILEYAFDDKKTREKNDNQD